jgi:putative sigma-54 modulation protein
MTTRRQAVDLKKPYERFGLATSGKPKEPRQIIGRTAESSLAISESMKLHLRTRNVDLSPELQDQLREGIYRALGRVSPWIREIDVVVSDTNGPRGGPDKQCRMILRGRSIASIVVEQLGVDVRATVAAVAERAERALLRSVDRSRSLGYSLVPS